MDGFVLRHDGAFVTARSAAARQSMDGFALCHDGFFVTARSAAMRQSMTATTTQSEQNPGSR